MIPGSSKQPCGLVLALLLVVCWNGLQVEGQGLTVRISREYTPPPDAVLGPNEYRAASGPLTLTCNVEGASGTVMYTWTQQTLEDENVELDSSNQIEHSVIFASDSGTYFCSVRDSLNRVGIGSIEVNIVGIGVYVRNGDVDGDGNADDFAIGAVANNSLVVAGNSGNFHFRFQCHSESMEHRNGEFIGLDGVALPGSNDGETTGALNVRLFSNATQDPATITVRSRITFEPVLTASEQGVYTCRLPDSSGELLEVSIGVFQPGFNTTPTISSLSFNATSRTFTCLSTGSPATTVTWRKDGVQLNVDGTTIQQTQRVIDRRQSTYENKLFLNVELEAINGAYSCLVSNVLGSSSQDFVVLDIMTPQQSLRVGEVVTINCTSDLDVSSIQWLFNDQVVAEEASGQSLLEFTFNPVEDALHGREYMCRATLTDDPSIIYQDTFIIEVEVPMPAMEVSINSQGTLEAGQQYTLNCTATKIIDGLANTPTLQWLDPMGNLLTTASDITVGNLITTSTSAVLSLTFNPLHTSHGGQYTCEANLESPAVEGGIGASSVQSITLQIPSPTIAVNVPTGPMYAGTEVSINCSIVLNEAVDTGVDVMVTWNTDAIADLSTDSRISISEATLITPSPPTFIATLTFSPLASDHAGSYTCEASIRPDPDSVFITMSSGMDTGNVDVTVLTPPEVAISTEGSATAGQQYTLSCIVTTVEGLLIDPDVEWRDSDSNAVSGEDVNVGSLDQNGATFTRTLTFNPMHTSHGGQYTCRARITIAEAGIDFSNTSSEIINVQIPPPTISFSEAPTLDSLYEGVHYTLTCSIQLNSAVDSEVTVAGRWLKSGAPLNDDSDRITIFGISESGQFSYETAVVFNLLRLEDDGNYACEATVTPQTSFVTGDMASSMVTVDVQSLPPPQITIVPDGAATAGETYTLTCRVEVVEGLPVSPTVTWRDSFNNPVTGESGITVGSPLVEGSTITLGLSFSLLHTSHGGYYICSASLELEDIYNATLSEGFNVTVEIPAPVVTITAETGTLYAGTDSSLICSAELDPAVDTAVMVVITWTGPDGTTLSSDGRLIVTDTSGSGITYERTLSLNPLNTSDSGNYVCTTVISPSPPSDFITTSTPSTEIEEIDVQALPPPEITISREGNPIAGQQYSLTCTVTVVEDLVVGPSVVWLNSNGDPVSGEDITVGNAERMGTTTTLNLVFEPLRTSHGGAYTCRASISVAAISLSDLSSTSSADINVAIPQPTVEVTSLQPTYNGTQFNLTCTIELDSAVDTGVDVNVVWRTSDSTVTTDSERCIVISDTDMISTLVYWSVLTFNPLGDNSRVGNRYFCEASIVSDPTSDFVTNAAGTVGYDLSVQALPLPEVSFIPSANATVAGLQYGLACTVTVVENLFVDPDIVWLGPDNNQLNSGGGIGVSLERSGSTTVLTLTFTSLATADAGQYTCQACISINKVDIQDHCAAIIADLTFSVPELVQNLTTESVSESSVVATWDEPLVTNGAIVRYAVEVLEYQQIGDLEVEQVDLEGASQDILSPITEATISGLVRSVPYSVCVAAANLAGTGEPACKDFFSQQGAPSRGPRNVTAERLNITAVQISWNLLNLVEARGFVQHYVITYTPTAVSTGTRRHNKRQDRTVTVGGSANSGTVSDLEAGVAYEVTVHAVNVENGQLLVGPPSDSVLVEDDTTLFQVQLRGISSCLEWMTIGTNSKLADIIRAVEQNIEERCQCGFSQTHISGGVLRCFSNASEVTFRARVHGTPQTPSMQLVSYIEQWVESGASVLVQEMILRVDSTCQPVVIDSFDDPECASSVAQPPSEGAKSNIISTGVLIGGVVGGVVVVTLIAIIIFIVVIVVCHRNRRAKHTIQRKRRSGVTVTELRNVTRPGYRPTTLTNDAYGIPNSHFEERYVVHHPYAHLTLLPDKNTADRPNTGYDHLMPRSGLNTGYDHLVPASGNNTEAEKHVFENPMISGNTMHNI